MKYRNLDTGDVVTRRARDPRLDGLPDRWELLDDGEAGGTPGPAQLAEQAAQHAEQAAADADQAAEQLGAQTVDQGPAQPVAEHAEPTRPGEPPSRSASRAEWADYALRAGMVPKAVSEMTEAQLVEHFR